MSLRQKIVIKAQQCQQLCQAEIEGWRPNWKEWVLLESKRRLLLYFPPLLKLVLLIRRQDSDATLCSLPAVRHQARAKSQVSRRAYSSPAAGA
jgi:hypothetical protein